MEKVNSFDILIIGTDINAYYMSRCYYEEYHRKANIIGKEVMWFTSCSNITNVVIEPNLWDSKTFVDTLVNYHKNNFKDVDKVLLISSNDYYVRLITENEDVLKKYYVFNYPDYDIVDKFLVKDKFYTNFKSYGLDMPKTIVYSFKNKINLKDELKEFKYPLIMKAGDGFEYHKHEFEGMKKVYKVNDLEELNSELKSIENSGYNENVVIQEFIPGGDDMLFDSIFYVSKSGEIILSTFAQIGLQERTPSAVGNCTVLINGYNQFGGSKEEVIKLGKFLKKVGYRGFAEFDLKYDIRDKKFKVLEINPRQARSSYYLCACGYNLVKYLVDDCIYNRKLKKAYIDEELLLTIVPKKIIKDYITNEKYKNKALELYKKGKYASPLKCRLDNKFKRKIFLFLKDINYIKKYRNNKF